MTAVEAEQELFISIATLLDQQMTFAEQGASLNKSQRKGLRQLLCLLQRGGSSELLDSLWARFHRLEQPPSTSPEPVAKQDERRREGMSNLDTPSFITSHRRT